MFMNKIFNKLIMVCLLIISYLQMSHAQNNYDKWIKTGTVMSYMVNYNAKNYDFIVGMINFYPNLKFTWEMNYPIRNKGLVEITKKAMDEATEQNNGFSAGDYFFNDKTTVWVSYSVYNALKNKEPITIKAGDDDEELNYVKDYMYETTINDSTVFLKSLYAESNLGDKFWILDDPNNPIILKMVLDWNIEIGSIHTKEYLEN